MSDFYYLVGDSVIRVTAKTRPNSRSKALYRVQEYDGVTWVYPAFPEIAYKTLSQATFLGRAKRSKGGILE